MKILWFTGTPSKASIEFGYKNFGAGWTSALETLILNDNVHEISICFFYHGAEYKKITKDGVIYYGIPLKNNSGFQRILNRYRGVLNDSASFHIDKIIEDFKPDLIHVFGTEMGYGQILINKFDKVLFHLQGLVNPIEKVYLPNGITDKMVLRRSGVANIIRGLTAYHNRLLLKSKAKRELMIIKKWKYFSGRTEWDRNFINLVNPDSVYFHCDELLRPNFFKTEWTPPSNLQHKKRIIIGTTINPAIYKGLDLIYKVLDNLKEYDICWKVFGLKEEDYLNDVVKKILKIKINGKATLKFYGQIDSDILIDELKTCHFFVHPSYIDNSPNSVCEAMLLGMPVLSSSVGGVKSLITNKENGFLFNPYDQYDLSGLLVYLIDHYDEAVLVGKNAKTTAIKRHDPGEILATMNSIYNTIYNAQ